VPALGHLPITMVTNGAVDRTTCAWIADGEGRSTVKNTLAVLVRVMEQAVRDGLITANPPASRAGSASTSSPRTNSTTPARSPCTTGAHCRNSPRP
jgi:hypothetical protein